MGMIEEVATYLDTQSTRFALGTNLFLNWLDDTPGTSAAVIETGGSDPSRVFKATVAAWENARFQLLCRSTSSSVARANIDAAWTIYEGVTNQTLSGSTYLRISAVQSPFMLTRDDQGRSIFACNFDVMRRR